MVCDMEARLAKRKGCSSPAPLASPEAETFRTTLLRQPVSFSLLVEHGFEAAAWSVVLMGFESVFPNSDHWAMRSVGLGALASGSCKASVPGLRGFGSGALGILLGLRSQSPDEAWCDT